jgi:hypothetical protein
MALFMISKSGWGLEMNLVRAGSRREACTLVKVDPEDSRIECEELRDGDDGILWSYEDSPDSVRDD